MKTNDRELTATAVLLGLFLSVVMGAANVYLGLRAGMTISASIPAAVVATGFLRTLGRRSVLEANMVQTTASAGESLAAGIIFTMPALVLAGIWSSFHFWTTSLVALAGGMLGILMMVPLRKAIVIDAPELRFPEGVACAQVLEAGAGESLDETRTSGGVRLLLGGMLVGAAIKFLTSWLGVLATTVSWGTRWVSRTFYFGIDNSPALISVGVIVGLPVAFQVFLGGAFGWFVMIPVLSGGETGAVPSETAYDIWSTQIRYIGVGAMVVGGLAAIWRVRGGIKAALMEMRSRFAAGESDAELPHTERNLGTRTLLIIGVACVLVTAGVYYSLLKHEVGITLLMTAVAITLAFFLTAVASYIVGLVGGSNSPVSGMTITALLITGGLVYLFDYSGASGIVAMLGVAGIVCCVACTAGDICNDLKTGHLVGASPRNQQIVQILGVLVAAFVMAPVLTVLHEGSLKAGRGGIGGKELPAPQAGLFASLAEGFFGDSRLPWDMVAWGIVAGLTIILASRVLAPILRTELHVMPVAVGLYLPVGLTVPILLGGLVDWLIRRKAGPDSRNENRAILIASGAIAGESLLGVLLGALAFFGVPEPGVKDLMQPWIRDVLSVAAILGMCAWVYRTSRR